jgi:hypothetical protein
MKATDFDLSKDLKLDPTTGIATFRESRLVVLDAAALGLLRQDLVESLGLEEARRLFLRFGYQHGYSDFLQMKLAYQFDSEMDLLASGPVIHSWEGIVQATPKEIRFDRQSSDFYFTGVWTNSYEAEQYLTFNHAADQPVCWSLMGYASGWCTAFFGSPVIAIEPVCMGKGDDHCEWLIQPPSAWGTTAKPYVDALSSLLGGK